MDKYLVDWIDDWSEKLSEKEEKSEDYSVGFCGGKLIEFIEFFLENYLML